MSVTHLWPHPEEYRLLVAHGDSTESWGELEPLRQTSWSSGVRIISGEAYSNALHGHTDEMIRLLGKLGTRAIPTAEGRCAAFDECIIANVQLCQPMSKGAAKKIGPPDCYDPPLVGANPEVVQVFREVALAWASGRHVIVVVGAEFSLR